MGDLSRSPIFICLLIKNSLQHIPTEMSEAKACVCRGFFLQVAAAVVNWCAVGQGDNLLWPLKKTVVGCGSPLERE
ncbi:hypothetical protein [Pseudomonas sp. NPDC087817]|uniref:hypothetical protein n=1 Tax=Pseudomonas sp. NPDC087817 TaxID=3364451 RepID=UPI00382A3C40